jgi:D-alanyl-D-alanine dipeptidase
MREAGFHAIQTEWWHFNGVSKEFARANFKVIP